MSSTSKGEITCNTSTGFRLPAVLWIDNSAVGDGFDYPWIEVSGEVGNRRESGYWRRIAAGEVSGNAAQITGDTTAGLSSGTLYLRTDDQRPDSGICLLTLIVDEPVGPTNACLNPLVLAFDTQLETVLPTEYCRFREPPYLLDIHPTFHNEDMARAELHAELHRNCVRAGALGPDSPALTQLLFGKSAEVGALPFLMLDAFGKTFLLEGLSSGTAVWFWCVDKPTGDNRWLADHCLRQLDVTPRWGKAPGEAMKVDGREKAIRREKDYLPWPDPKDLRGAIEASHLPRVVADVAMRQSTQFAERLTAHADGSRLFTFAFCDDLGNDLMPLSAIRVRFPDAPSPIEAPALIQLWQRTVENFQLDLKATPLSATGWWLDFLGDPGRVLEEPIVDWQVDNSWYWEFYESLFRRPIRYRARWELPRDKAGLGRSRLGGLILGADRSAGNRDLFPSLDRFQLLASGPLDG